MKQYIKYIVPALLISNLLATSYFSYITRTSLQASNEVVRVHEAVLLQIICTTQLPGIIDLTQCPK